MIPKFGQFFIYSPDKSNSVCKIFISTPSLDKEQTLGRLFGIIEIESPDRALWDTVNNIAEKLEKKYYGEDNIQITVGRPSRAISIEETFEKTIQEFNDNLIELIKGGKLANLLEKINIIIGIFKNKKIYFTAVGNTSAFLIHQLKSQEYRVINILDTTGGREEKINPFKILPNIINGEINRNDSLLFCTNSLLDYLSLDKIKQILTTQEPATASRHLKDLLLEASINTTFASIIIKLAPSSADETKSKTIEMPQKSLDHLVTTEKSTEEYLSPPFKFNIKKYFLLFIDKSKKITVTGWKNSLNYSKKQIKKYKQKTVSDQQPTTQPTPPSSLPPAANTKKIALGITAVTKNLFSIILNKDNQRQKKIHGLYAAFTGWLAKYIKKFRELPPLSRSLLIICLILFILLVYSVSMAGKNKMTAEEQQKFTDLVQIIAQKNNEMESALIYNDEKLVQELFGQTEELFSQLSILEKKDKKKFAEIKIKLNSLRIKLQRVIEVKPSLLADFNEFNNTDYRFDAATLTLAAGQFYTVNNIDNSFYSLNLQDKKIDSLGLNANNPKIKLATDYKNTILYYHGGNGIISFNPAEKSLAEVEINLAGQENKINDLNIYLNRLYILTAANNQIYRYQANNNNFSSPRNWIRDGSDLTKAISLSIDGDIYLLTSDGKIEKFTGGYKQKFDQPRIEPAITQPIKIWTDLDSDYLYILEATNRRLIVINKDDGKLKAQYTAEQFGQLKDMVIKEKEKKAYLLNGNLIYQITLQ